MILFETATDGLEALAVAGRGSRILVVVFSQVRVPPGHFGLSRLFARTTHACLFLNQPENQWYRGAEAAIDAAVAAARLAAGAERVVFYGSSMGAFGALSTAARHPEAEVVAFAPDLSIGEPGSQSATAGLREFPGELGLLDHLGVPRTGPVTIAAPLFDPYDAGVAARLAAADFPSTIRIVPLASGHEVHDHLYTVNVIRRVIASFSRDLATEAASRNLHVDRPNWIQYAAFSDLARRHAGGHAVPIADLRALGMGANPGAVLLEADLLETTGDLSGAEAVLDRLAIRVAASPALASLPKRYLKIIPRRRIALLQRLGDLDGAERVRCDAAALYPTDVFFGGSTTDADGPEDAPVRPST